MLLGINDGAACVILMSEDKANELGLDILAYVDGYATVGLDNKVMGLGPIYATHKVLSKLNVNIEDIDLSLSEPVIKNITLYDNENNVMFNSDKVVAKISFKNLLKVE